jgi:hypothetical protein
VWLGDGSTAFDGLPPVPLTQLGFVRVSSNPAIGYALEVTVAREVQRDLTKHPRHTFWADGVSVLDRAVPGVIGTSQFTDAYLLGLAVHRRGRRRRSIKESLAGRARPPTGSRPFRRMSGRTSVRKPRDRRPRPMRKTIVQSLSLPTEIAAESARVAKELGKSRSTLFLEAIQAYLRLYRFRKLREEVKPRKAYRRIKGEEQVDRLVHDYRRGKRA